MIKPADSKAGTSDSAQLELSSPAISWQSVAIAANFKPAAIAERCGLSLRTIQRYFKKHYGVTLSHWLRNYRLQLAYERLTKGESIKSVAYSLGYKQLSHFSRDFKATYGCAPRFLDPTDHKCRSTQQSLLLHTSAVGAEA
jgi:AraC-like DNA-binding protein